MGLELVTGICGELGRALVDWALGHVKVIRCRLLSGRGLAWLLPYYTSVVHLWIHSNSAEVVRLRTSYNA